MLNRTRNMQKATHVRAAGTILALSLCIFGTAQTLVRVESRYQLRPLNTAAKIDASWPIHFDSIAGLKGSSQVIVVGSVSAMIRTYRSPIQIPYTDFAFHVDSVVSDPGHRLTTPSITIHQVGGFVNNFPLQVEDDPLLVPGERDVLFLRQYSPGSYAVVGGPQGRFQIRSGVVQAVSATHVRGFTGSVPLDSFLASVRSA